MLYMIRINGHLGATVLSAFPAMVPRRHGAHTVLTGLLDRSALYSVLAEIHATSAGAFQYRGRGPRRGRAWPARYIGSAMGNKHDRRGKTASPGDRVNMQPSGLMNIYASPSCPENARSCRRKVVAELFMGPRNSHRSGRSIPAMSASRFHPFRAP